MEDGMKLLALVDSPDHVCCRYRIRAFTIPLQDAGWSLSCQGLERGVLPRLFQLRRASQFDAVILQRKLLPLWQLSILRRASRHLVFDFDDAVLFRDSYDRRGHESAWRYRRFAQTMRLVDTVVAGNDFLADCALRAGARVERVHVIPTCVDPERYTLACHQSAPGSVDLVWIGSSSTLRGVEDAAEIWARLSQAIPHLRIRIICDRFPKSFSLPIIPVLWNEATEASALAAGQIGVSWLPEDAWSLGKCGLKVLQYQAAGLPVVANPVGTHSEMIRTGETGILAANGGEWVDAVNSLAVDARLRRKMGLLARQQVESNYSISAWAETFVSSMTGTPRSSLGPSWKIDRPVQRDRRSGFEPYAAKVKPFRTLNQIGDR
jgi:glycosyltransferase involved in cell wall biosynthesis